jgi:hypothetical protein
MDDYPILAMERTLATYSKWPSSHMVTVIIQMPGSKGGPRSAMSKRKGRLVPSSETIR